MSLPSTANNPQQGLDEAAKQRIRSQGGSYDSGVAKEIAEVSSWHPDNKKSAQVAERLVGSIEADIMSDLVTVPIVDPVTGFPTGHTKVVAMSDYAPMIPQIYNNLLRMEAAGATDESVDPMVAMADQFATRRVAEPVTPEMTASPGVPVANTVLPVPVAPVVSLDAFGLGFLTTPPSLPDKTVKLQLSGPMKFSTALCCHTFAIGEQVIVLVADSRVKSEIIDLSLEDASVEAALLFEDGEKMDIYPPVPGVITYDVGVLRHFVFIRKYEH